MGPVYFQISRDFPGRELPYAKNFEINRYTTFDTWNYPANPSVFPSKLAKSGFYYLKCEDWVQCAFCDLQCRGKEALQQHPHNAEFCPLLNDELPVNLRSGPNIQLPKPKQQVLYITLSIPIDYFEDCVGLHKFILP
jgi:hypothetical protein